MGNEKFPIFFALPEILGTSRSFGNPKKRIFVVCVFPFRQTFCHTTIST